jgi:hypothetical protein
MIPIRTPPATPAMGTVKTHPKKIQPNARQLTARAVCQNEHDGERVSRTTARNETNACGRSGDAHGGRHRDTICIVSMKALAQIKGVCDSHCEARSTVMEDPSSMEKPREGDIKVSRLPSTRMTFCESASHS